MEFMRVCKLVPNTLKKDMCVHLTCVFHLLLMNDESGSM